MHLHLHVKPGARKNQLSVLPDGTIKVKIAAPPVDGKANEALVEFLAEVFEVSKSSVELLKGEAGRHKKVSIHKKEEEIKSILSRFSVS